ncbi:hypothetical protein TIFTF001_020061 [Ficus carica]|uniref:Uncharacterized protein n=1 Tax=Ficus carica TaxID=3494 RepID=A0AA88AA14_FICCA|nr:hypothetical protein TIFTF001_020061 [Ficus carica]
MHGYYKDMVKNGEDPRAHPPSNMRSTEDWEWLCDNIFSNPQWLNRSNASVRNRGKLPHVHRGGSKSFIAHRTQELSDGIVELGRIELFRKTHWNAAHGWINEEAETRYNCLLELRQQREDNNEVVHEAAICAQVLGCERNEYIYQVLDLYHIKDAPKLHLKLKHKFNNVLVTWLIKCEWIFKENEMRWLQPCGVNYEMSFLRRCEGR